jgi:hypothetical protein
MKAPKVEPIKRLVEIVAGLGVPSREEALASVRNIKPVRMKFRDEHERRWQSRPTTRWSPPFSEKAGATGQRLKSPTNRVAPSA